VYNENQKNQKPEIENRENSKKVIHMRYIFPQNRQYPKSEYGDFMAATVNKIFSGYQSHQLVKIQGPSSSLS
jgi:hypothetical protein